MAYVFSFDGKSLWALGAGSVVLCILVFFAGLLLGVNWRTPDAVASAPQAAPTDWGATAQPAVGGREVAATYPGASAAGLPYAPAPQGPPPYDAAAARDYYAQDYGAQGYEARGYAARPPAAADYGAQQRYAAPPSAADTPAAAREVSSAPPVNLAREAARLSATGTDPDPRLISEADDAPAAPQGSPGYSVQAGAYADETEARRLIVDLENKGYTPSLFRGLDAEGRAWFAVRVGAYANQREASRAAENFSRQERLKAAVRPSNSL